MDRTSSLTTAESLRAVAGFAIAALGLLLVATLLLAPFGLVLFAVGCAFAGRPLIRAFETAREQSAVDAEKQFVASAVDQVRSAGADWVRAGPVIINEAGQLHFPELPRVPGLRRMDLIGPSNGQYAVAVAQDHDLRETLRDTGSEVDRNATAQLKAHLIAGGTIEIYYIDKVAGAAGQLDMSDEADRKAVIETLRRQAEHSGTWDFGLCEPASEGQTDGLVGKRQT